jgi:uncharacterized glyoxalase superfamily protein PhnB
MTTDVPTEYPALCPYIYYVDLPAAIDFLDDAFGFRERFKEVRQDGSLGHVEMELGTAVLMMGSPPGVKSPAQLGQSNVGMYVHVPDVDAHYQKAVAAGADVEGEPEDMPYGVRSYGVKDLEGHQWWFVTPL